MGNRISILWADRMMTFPEIESGRVNADRSNEVRFRITFYAANGKRQFVSRDQVFALQKNNYVVSRQFHP